MKALIIPNDAVYWGKVESCRGLLNNHKTSLEAANARYCWEVLEQSGGQVGRLAELPGTLKPGWDRMNGLGG